MGALGPDPQPGVHPYSAREELANAVTHLLGVVLAVGGVPVLLTLAALYGTAREVSTFSVYSATLILTYLASTAYHATAPHSRWKPVLRKLDHISVYLLIAGTYTPFMIVGIGGVWGWSLFGILWGLAAAGLVVKAFFGARFDVISTVAYILMGWAGLAAIVPMVEALEPVTLWLVFSGGAAYTLGALIYLWDRLPHNHAVWHVFCLAGSVLHFIGVFFLIP